MSSSPPVSVCNSTSARPIACLQCRKRRSACSKDRPRCSRCRDSGLDCIYEETVKVLVTENYLRELEAKVKEYEAFKTQGQASPMPASEKVRPHSWDEGGEIEDELPLLEPFTNLSMSPPGSSSVGFKGPGSSDNFLLSMRNISGLQDDGGSLDTIANLYDPDALQSCRSFTRNKARLPPLDVARRLFAVQYTYIGTIFSFTNPDAFERSLLEAYQGLPEGADSKRRLAYAKVLMILAFGKLYSINQWIDFKGPPGFDYFTAAVDLLPDVHEQGSILYAETLAYVGYFMQNMNRRDAAFLYIGMALRMAISLGLHQEVTGTGLDEIALEHRRRVWWSIYSLDRIVSVKSGNPLTIQDEDVGISMPSKLPGEPDYCPGVVLRHYTELSRILGEVLTCIYRKTPKSGSRLMASVRNIIMSLNKWHRELPDDLRFDPTKLSTSRESVSTFLHYYQCINMTARPLLFHVVHRRLKTIRGGAAKEQDWRIGLSQTTVSVIEMCISAAHDTINMMTIAAQLDLVATYGYMDGEHAFSATIVLVVVCGAFPTNCGTLKAMSAGLDLLRGMSERGNSHMGARYELLAHLKSILMPDAGSFATAGPSLPTRSAVRTSAYSEDESHSTGHTTDRAAQNQDVMMFGHLSNVRAANLGFSSTPGYMLDADKAVNHAFTDTFYDVDADFGSCVGGGDDLMLWEEGFADPAGVDLTQWTQATQMVIDWGNL